MPNVAPVSGAKLKAFCPVSCSLNENRIGAEAAEQLADLRAKGYGRARFGRVANNITGKMLGTETIQNHFKHYHEAAPPEESDGAQNDEKVGDLAILESIIAAGYRNSKNWRPSIKDTMEAMKLKMQLTGNSAFEDMLEAMALAGDFEEEEVMPENPDALGSDSERAQESTDEDG